MYTQNENYFLLFFSDIVNFQTLLGNYTITDIVCKRSCENFKTDTWQAHWIIDFAIVTVNVYTSFFFLRLRFCRNNYYPRR